MNQNKLRQVLPKIYRINHPQTPFRVIFTDPAGRRIQRHFKDEGEAKAHHRDLLKKAQVGGTAGLVLDAEMRAEYFAARQALGGASIMQAVATTFRTGQPALPVKRWWTWSPRS